MFCQKFSNVVISWVSFSEILNMKLLGLSGNVASFRLEHFKPEFAALVFFRRSQDGPKG